MEQGLRANALAKRSGIAVVARADLSAARLAHAIEQVIAAPLRATKVRAISTGHTAVSKSPALNGAPHERGLVTADP